MSADNTLRRDAAWALKHDDIDDVLDGANQLWDALERLGIVDSFDGMECRRVLPAALAFIRYEANRGPDTTAPFPSDAWYEARSDWKAQR